MNSRVDAAADFIQGCTLSGSVGAVVRIQRLPGMHQWKIDAYGANLRTVFYWTVTDRGDTFDVRVGSGHTEDD